MISVLIRDYRDKFENGYTSLTFTSLDSLKDYIFSKASTKTKDDIRVGYMRDGNSQRLEGYITWYTDERKYDKSIVYIKGDGNEILFSNGAKTSGILHCSRAVADMIDAMQSEIEHPVYNFVE